LSKNKSKIICLVGFMGSGKSTIGKLLASKSGYSFIDLDEYIEAKLGLTITEIFDQKGEAFFREYELEVLKEILLKDQQVILALGGGTVCNERAWHILREVTTVYLKLTSAQLYDRLLKNRSERPLLSGLNETELIGFINDKLESRMTYYERSDFGIDNSKVVSEGVQQIVSQILE